MNLRPGAGCCRLFKGLEWLTACSETLSPQRRAVRTRSSLMGHDGSQRAARGQPKPLLGAGSGIMHNYLWLGPSGSAAVSGGHSCIGCCPVSLFPSSLMCGGVFMKRKKLTNESIATSLTPPGSEKRFFGGTEQFERVCRFPASCE